MTVQNNLRAVVPKCDYFRGSQHNFMCTNTKYGVYFVHFWEIKGIQSFEFCFAADWVSPQLSLCFFALHPSLSLWLFLLLSASRCGEDSSQSPCMRQHFLLSWKRYRAAVDLVGSGSDLRRQLKFEGKAKFMCQSNSTSPLILLKLPRCCRVPETTSSTDCSSVSSLRGNNCFVPSTPQPHFHNTRWDWQVPEVCCHTAGSVMSGWLKAHTVLCVAAAFTIVIIGIWWINTSLILNTDSAGQWRLLLLYQMFSTLKWGYEKYSRVGVWQHFIESEFIINHLLNLNLNVFRFSSLAI